MSVETELRGRREETGGDRRNVSHASLRANPASLHNHTSWFGSDNDNEGSNHQ
jgi:hypothetical protein